MMTEYGSDMVVREVPIEDKQRQLEGKRPAAEQQVVIDPHHTDTLQQQTPSTSNDAADLEMLTELELRAGETSDAFEAAEEGLVYIPPVDPPTTVSDDYEDAQIASGMSSSALDEPYNHEHHATFLPGDDEVRARVRDALRADSATTAYADWLDIETSSGIVTLRGVVSDLDESDNLLAVAQRVEGVREVFDELHVTF